MPPVKKRRKKRSKEILEDYDVRMLKEALELDSKRKQDFIS